MKSTMVKTFGFDGIHYGDLETSVNRDIFDAEQDGWEVETKQVVVLGQHGVLLVWFTKEESEMTIEESV